MEGGNLGAFRVVVCDELGLGLPSVVGRLRLSDGSNEEVAHDYCDGEEQGRCREG